MNYATTRERGIKRERFGTRKMFTRERHLALKVSRMRGLDHLMSSRRDARAVLHDQLCTLINSVQLISFSKGGKKR